MGMVHGSGNAVPFHGDHHPVKVATHMKSRNLLNQSYFNTEVNGITLSTDEYGTITVSGKPNTTGTFYCFRDFPAGTYTISVRFLNPLGSESNKHIGVRVRNKDNKQYVQLVDTGIDYASAQVENEAYQQLKIGILVSKDITYDNYKLQIQFEEGSEATSFEPYGLIEEPIFEPIDQAQDGKTLTFENTYNDTAEVTVFGESTQDGYPTPEAPVSIESIKSVELVSSNADGSKSASRTIDLQGHELRSLPDGTRDELLVHSDGTVELVQRVGVYDVASDTGYVATNIDGVSKYFQQKIPGTIVSGDVIIRAGNQLCTHFIEENPYTSKFTCAWIFSQDVSDYSIFRALIPGFSTADQYMAFFGYNDVRVIYRCRNPQTIQLPSIDPIPTYHPYTFVDGNGADISARVRVFE